MKRRKKLNLKWLVGIFLLIIALGACGDNEDNDSTEADSVLEAESEWYEEESTDLIESEEDESEVIDYVSPTITCNVDEFLVEEASLTSDYIKSLSAYDETDGDITDQIIIDDSEVSYGEIGTYQIYVKVADNSGNETEQIYRVVIQDSIAPIIALTQTAFYLTEGASAPDYEDNVNVTDNIDGNVTERVYIDDSKVDYNVPGDYEVIYKITDSSGNEAIEKATVTVEEKEETVIEESEEDASSGVEVLITRTGECYHRRECGNGNYFWASLEEAEARGLRPCKKCY